MTKKKKEKGRSQYRVGNTVGHSTVTTVVVYDVFPVCPWVFSLSLLVREVPLTSGVVDPVLKGWGANKKNARKVDYRVLRPCPWSRYIVSSDLLWDRKPTKDWRSRWHNIISLKIKSIFLVFPLVLCPYIYRINFFWCSLALSHQNLHL